MEHDDNMIDMLRDYCENSEQAKFFKKVADKEKEELKSYLIDRGDKGMEDGKYSVQIRTSEKETMDEVKLLEVLKKEWEKTHPDEPCPWVKTVECIDMDALESDMFNSRVPMETLLAIDKCRVKTVTQALYYSIKGE